MRKPGEPRPHFADSKNDKKLKPGTESYLVIADPDGKHPKTLLTGTAGEGATTIATLDWR